MSGHWHLIIYLSAFCYVWSRRKKEKKEKKKNVMTVLLILLCLLLLNHITNNLCVSRGGDGSSQTAYLLANPNALSEDGKPFIRAVSNYTEPQGRKLSKSIKYSLPLVIILGIIVTAGVLLS